MRKRSRALVIATVVGAVTLGFPGRLVAAPTVPGALARDDVVVTGVAPGRTITRTVALPWRVNMAGVSFLDADRSARGVVVRLRAAGSSQVLEFDSEDLPDGAELKRMSARSVSDPVWIGTASSVELTISVARAAKPVRDVRLHLLNTLGDGYPESFWSKALHAVGRFLTMQPERANASSTQPTIITRAGWGANESWRDGFAGYASDVRMVFLHHSDNANSYTKAQSPAIMRAIYHYHRFTRGFSDIAYNFLVDRFGQIFEGRWGGIDKAVIGAHTLGFNSHTTGIAVIGNFSSAYPSAAVLSSLTRLIAWKMDIHHIPADGTVHMTSSGNERYAKGRVVSFNRISGHRDAKPTACPGTHLYYKLRSIRYSAEKLGQPKIYLPGTSTAIVRPDNDGVDETSVISATFGRSVTWTVTITDSSGVVRRTFTGSGYSVWARWNGTDAASVLQPTGEYHWQLDATDSTGHRARSASGDLSLVTTHPDGTLVRDNATYTLEGMQRKDETDHIAFESVFGSLPAITTGPAERGRYIAALTPLSLRDGTLFVSQSDGARYIWSGGTLRRFAADANASPPVDVFASLGYSTSALIPVAQDYLNTLAPGAPVDSTTVHPRGTVVRDSAGALSVLGQGTRAALTDLAMRSRYRAVEVVAATAGDIAMPLEATAIAVRTGSVVRATDGGAPWLIASDGTRRRFISSALFGAMGYSSAMLLSATTADLNRVPIGAVFG